MDSSEIVIAFFERMQARDWRGAGLLLANGTIVRGVEHWVTERSETPPEWRIAYASVRPDDV